MGVAHWFCGGWSGMKVSTCHHSITANMTRSETWPICSRKNWLSWKKSIFPAWEMKTADSVGDWLRMYLLELAIGGQLSRNGWKCKCISFPGVLSRVLHVYIWYFKWVCNCNHFGSGTGNVTINWNILFSHLRATHVNWGLYLEGTKVHLCSWGVVFGREH